MKHPNDAAHNHLLKDRTLNIGSADRRQAPQCRIKYSPEHVLHVF